MSANRHDVGVCICVSLEAATMASTMNVATMAGATTETVTTPDVTGQTTRQILTCNRSSSSSIKSRGITEVCLH